MGHSASARCSACGYGAFLMLGAGRSDFKERASWPVSCATCAKITTANYYKRPLVCEACEGTEVVPLNDPSVWQGDGEQMDRWANLTLSDGHYRCPKCGKFELRFDRGGPQVMFD
jgi:hypothetical protein